MTCALTVRPLCLKAVLATVVLSIAAWSALLVPAWAQSDQSWPSIQGGPEHTSAVVDPSLAPPLRRAWLTHAPGTDGRLSPAVVDGTVAVALGRAAVVGLDSQSGRQQWTLDRATGPLLSAALDPAGGTVFYPEGATRSDSAIVAIDLSTHSRRWRSALGDEALSSPVVLGGTVFVTARDQYIYALDASTGSLEWKVRTIGTVPSSPAVSGGRVFVVSVVASSEAVRVYAFDAASGHVDWSYLATARTSDVSAPSVAGNRVIVGFGDLTARSFDAASGRVAWEEPVRGDFGALSAPAVSGGAVFLQDREGGVYRLSLGTGRRIWDFQFPSNADSGSPLVVDGSVYVGLDDGTVGAIDVASGHLVWREGYAFGAIGPMAPAGDRVLVPAVGPGGGLLGLEHDPTGTLTDILSPTHLNLPLALADFGVAFVGLLVLLAGFFGLLQRRQEESSPDVDVPDEPPGAPGGAQ